jgi:hypothetical protein
VDEAVITPAGEGFRPLSTSAIGNLVDERNLYEWRFRVVPGRPGTLVIPPVLMRLGGRSGSSEPVRLTVRALPASGRRAEFLGGVGAFEVKAEATPTTLRTGQELEYRLTVTGPAARGMSAGPRLDRFDRVPLGLRVDPLPVEAVSDPPSRLFRFRLRPTRAGEATLPPVAVAAFDPKSGRYVTKVAAGVPVRVLDVPRLGPATLEYPAPVEASGPQTGRLVAWIAGLATIGLAASAATLLAVRRARARRGKDWRARRLAARLAAELDASSAAAEVGRRITEGLAGYLNVVAGRPLGALTPAEAERGLAQTTGSGELGVRSARLVAGCDRAQFAASGPDADELVGEARRLFIELQRRNAVAEGGDEDAVP